MKTWAIRKWGAPLPRLWRRLEAAARKNISYKRDIIMGFPGTPPVDASVEAFRMFASEHPNNIGCHTRKTDKPAELGFGGTQKLEKQLVYAVASLAGAADPETEIDGYVCKGGTEGNDHGMWLGRNKLNEEDREAGSNHRKHGIAVLTSVLAHYSIEKSFFRLFPPFEGVAEHELRALSPNMYGELTAPIVEKEIRSLMEAGYRKFLVVLTAGTTNLGSVDQIPEIASALSRLRENLKIMTYLHVDAAFGGFVLPFLEPEYAFGFHGGNEAVDSVSIDLHKMGYAPYCAGVFLCRKGYLEFTKTSAVYLASHEDFTTAGSRSGAIVAASWTAIHSVGLRGYQKKIQRCMELRDHLVTRLEDLNRFGTTVVKFYPQDGMPTRMNVVAVWLAKPFAAAMEEPNPHDPGGVSLRERFCVPYDDNFPERFAEGLWNPTKDNRVRAYRFVLMPHLTRDKINHFVTALEARAGEMIAKSRTH